jgi:ABC-type transport system involved in Fe-S cluster assembly fused permease/ATPase subunit
MKGVVDATTASPIENSMPTADPSSVRKTAVFIAHRLSTIMDCDVIVVLKEGRVVEKGTHAELIERDGVYAEMWRSQQEIDQ